MSAQLRVKVRVMRHFDVPAERVFDATRTAAGWTKMLDALARVL